MQTNSGSSTIVVKTPVLSGVGTLYRKHGLTAKTVVIFDDNTKKLFRDQVISTLESEGFRLLELTVPARETSKSLNAAYRLYATMIEAGVDRSWNLLAVGGGVVGDLGGFIAASYYRGIPVVQCPTTLLAMTDSAIGGKVAINHPLGKNLIGFFHIPELVLIDPSFLRTLPEREIYAGMAEVVKYGFIADRTFLDWLGEHFDRITALEEPFLTEAVKRSASIKADVVEKDFRETTGLRATLNFGHTFAHGLEKIAEYRYLRHGEAVTLGMICALWLSHNLGYLAKEDLRNGLDLLARFRFPKGVVKRRFLAHSSETLLENMFSDKKKLDSKLRFVLLKKPGEAFLLEENVDDREVLKAIERARAFVATAAKH
ncbi:MAG: 3-dehydroquinate synthase [Chlorobiaceae bacterium]|nr:3-dehydroquinate synthase [Chlorobiaceae bacterium]